MATSGKIDGRKERIKKRHLDSRPEARHFIVFCILALGGVGVSLYLVVAHYLRLADASAISACNFGGWLDCDVVNSSRYSEFLGVPVAVVGGVFYLMLAGISLYAARVKDRRFAAAAYLRFLSLVGLAESLYLGIISLFVIRAVCLFCVGLYAINIALLIVSWRTPSGGIGFFKVLDRALRTLIHRPRVAAMGAGVTIMMVGVFFYARLIGTDLRDANSRAQVSRIMVDGKSIGAAPGQVMGFHDSKVTLFLFSDFECPYCESSNEMFDRLIGRFGDRVRFVYKHFPLNGSCNPSVQSTGHPNACRASRAAVCAAEKGKFDVFHRAVFANGADTKGLSRAAKESGLDETELIRCTESLRAEELVEKDVGDGIMLGIQSTPSFFIGDMLIAGASDETTLADLLQKKLSANSDKP